MFPDFLLKESVEAEAILYKILNSFLILWNLLFISTVLYLISQKSVVAEKKDLHLLTHYSYTNSW